MGNESYNLEQTVKNERVKSFEMIFTAKLPKGRAIGRRRRPYLRVR